ncbi:MAG: hypothetical protein ACO29U_09810, partial [Crocinitomicaceae bacterium]
MTDTITNGGKNWKPKQENQNVQILTDEEQIENFQEKINEFEENIEEFESEIEEIQENPDGDYPDYLIDEKVEELVEDRVNDPMDFIREMGLEWENFI